MTPKNLFNIILKIFGLFFLREIVYLIPQLILTIPYLTNQDNFDSGQYSIGNILPFMLTLIVIAFYVFIIYQLLFNTNKILDKLNLTRDLINRNFHLIFQLH